MRADSQNGVSLIETSIVLALLLGGIALAVPTLTRSREVSAVVSAAHDMRNRLREARALSIARGESCRLRVVSSRAYALECQPGWSVVAEWPLGPDLILTASAIPQFHPSGNVVPTATFRVVHARAATRQVIVNATGRVRIP